MTGSAAGSRLCARPGFRDFEPIFEPLWELPEFQSLMAEVRGDMDAQLERVREMERRGELALIPRSE